MVPESSNSVGNRPSMQMHKAKLETRTDHSLLAMRAARRMRRIKRKRENGHVICHHLLQMLSDTQSSERGALGGAMGKPDATMPRAAFAEANDRQISLGL